MYTYAITRLPGENCAVGLTTSQLGAPDHKLLLQQHGAYCDTLRGFGLQVIELPPLAAYPDAYFVEDTAVIVPELAVITRPGAPSRRGEEESIAHAVAQYRPTGRIEPPGTVDGGDVLQVGKQLFIGLSERTNQTGAEQLADLLAPCNYQATMVPVGAGLHLKSSVNWVGGRTLLLTAELDQLAPFRDYDRIVVHQAEAYAANTLWINDHLLMPSGYPGTRAKLQQLGIEIAELDMGEVVKMDGGLTCMSLRF